MREQLARALRTLPRVAIFVTAIAELATGDLLYGMFCLVALVLTLIPALRARHLDAGIPLELELLLLWFMITDMVLGNSLGMYRVAWYDKTLHLGNSILIATIGFLAIYVVHLTQGTRFRPWLDGLAILLVTLGMGALWEISEYVVDQLFGRRTQGAPHQSPLDDTMFDLILDALGGVLGSILGAFYIDHSQRSRDRVIAFAHLAGRHAHAART